MRALNPSGLVESEAGASDAARPEAMGHAWIAIGMLVFLVVGLLSIGILPAAALFTLIAFLLNGSRKVPAILIAAVFTFLIWLIFGELLQLQLFPGMLFGGEL
jgi:hypothetical protein